MYLNSSNHTHVQIKAFNGWVKLIINYRSSRVLRPEVNIFSQRILFSENIFHILSASIFFLIIINKTKYRWLSPTPYVIRRHSLDSVQEIWTPPPKKNPGPPQKKSAFRGPYFLGNLPLRKCAPLPSQTLILNCSVHVQCIAIVSILRLFIIQRKYASIQTISGRFR